MANSTSVKVATYGLALPLFRIGIPAVSQFDDYVERLLNQSFAQENREREIRQKTLVHRRKTCVLFIEGLYQAFSCLVPDSAVSFPHSQRNYKQGQFGCISDYSYRNVDACYQALIRLGWITYCPGFLDQDDIGHPTTIAPQEELFYVDGRGKQRQHKIGNTQDITLDQARKQAGKLRAKITMGEDLNEAQNLLRVVPTISEFIHKVYLPYVEGYKRSWKCDRGLLKNHVEPYWGKKYLDQVTKSDLINLLANHRKTHAPGSCNRLIILLRYMFNIALKNGDVGITKNPTAGYPLMKENREPERYLSADEAKVLYEHLLESDNKMLQYIIPMLILTGARKREVLEARWEDFDFERKSWRIHTTKLGRPRHVPLSDGAISILQSMPRFGKCEWAFPNPKTLKPYVSIYYAWNTARNAAGLPDVKCHSLRHSYASFLVNAGRTLYEVQHLLGHTQIKTTQRYSHLTKDTLLDATNSVNTALGGMFVPMLSASPAAKVQLVQ